MDKSIINSTVRVDHLVTFLLNQKVFLPFELTLLIRQFMTIEVMEHVDLLRHLVCIHSKPSIKLKYGNIAEWDTSKVTDMTGLFEFLKLFNEPIGKWDVSNVTNMSFLFYAAYSFNQPLNSWNVSNVKKMSCIFGDTYAFNQPLDKWNVSNLRLAGNMFKEARIFNQPLDNWKLSSNLKYASGIFEKAHSFNQPETILTWKEMVSPEIFDSLFNYHNK